MWDVDSITILFDSKIKITSRAIWKFVWLAREEALKVAVISLPDNIDFSSDESDMWDVLRITLGDYGRLDNKVPLGFQQANPVVFDIKRLWVRQETQIVRLLTKWAHERLAQCTCKWHNLYLGPIEDIATFVMQHEERLYDTWERFKLLIKRCSRHKFNEMQKLQMFTIGLKAQKHRR